jgi:hypothetical protein
MVFPSIKIPFDIADMGRIQKHGQVYEDMLSYHSSFVERHDEPMEALCISFHLFALSMITTALFGGEPIF